MKIMRFLWREREKQFQLRINMINRRSESLSFSMAITLGSPTIYFTIN